MYEKYFPDTQRHVADWLRKHQKQIAQALLTHQRECILQSYGQSYGPYEIDDNARQRVNRHTRRLSEMPLCYALKRKYFPSPPTGFTVQHGEVGLSQSRLAEIEKTLDGLEHVFMYNDNNDCVIDFTVGQFCKTRIQGKAEKGSRINTLQERTSRLFPLRTHWYVGLITQAEIWVLAANREEIFNSTGIRYYTE